jgi:AraC-like DNA-binding protein
MEKVAWEGFSTHSVTRVQRVQRWNDYGSETLCRLSVDPNDRDQFDASLERVECGPLGLVRMCSTAASARGGEGGVGGWASVEQDALLVLVPERGKSLFEQERRTVELSPGDLLIRDLSKPWVHTCNDRLDFLMVKIPYSTLLPKVDDPARLLGTALPYHNPAVAMCTDVIRGANRTLRGPLAAQLASALSELILDSVGLLYRSTSEAAAWRIDRQKKCSIRRDAKNYIIRHLDDPELSVEGIALAMGLSQRRLQRAFTQAGETPSRFILEQRLDLAARMLTSGQRHSGEVSVLHIAMSAGFNDASHFSRSFSRRFGVAPSKYRGTPPV